MPRHLAPQSRARATGRWSLRTTAAVTAVALGLGCGAQIAFAAGGTVAYEAGAAPVVVLPATSLATAGSYYDGQTVDFQVTGSDVGETLSLASDAAPSIANGAVSIVDGVVYVGTGSIANAVGVVDPVLDGTAGKKLRVNFTAPFNDPSFEEPTLGWTTFQDRVDLGVTQLAGRTSIDGSSYSIAGGSCAQNPPNQDNSAPQSSASYIVQRTTAEKSSGATSLQLVSNMGTTNAGFDVVHGPAAWSDAFPGAAGDTLYFDWRAKNGSDAYHVFGYLLDELGNQTTVLSAAGNSPSASTNWATASVTLPRTGDYRFVFVAGTYDCTGGQAAGASLYIDNVRVFGHKVNGTVVDAIIRDLQYSRDTAHMATSTANRTVTVTTSAQGGAVQSDSVTVAVTYPPVPPVLTAPGAVTVTNPAEGADTYAPQTGTFSASDRNDTPITYAVQGSVPSGATVAGQTYSDVAVGSYGSLYVDATTGRWAYVPSAAAVDAVQFSNASAETFTLAVTSGTDTVTAPVTVAVSVPVGAPGVPTGVTTSTTNGAVDVSWTAPAWPGGAPIDHYTVEYSTDGTTWQSVSTTGAATTVRIPGLANGTAYQLRVSAVNTGSGTSAVTSVVTATPHPIAPDTAPVLGTVTVVDNGLDVDVVAPVSDGGSPVTGYEYSVDGGTTWLPAPATSPVRVRDLPNGTAATVVVRAVNAVGTGVVSAPATGTPVGLPRAPGATVTPVLGGVSIAWTTPDLGGLPLAGYEYTTDGGLTWQTLTGTSPVVVSPLTPGTPVAVAVRALNALGAGTSSAVSTVTPYELPTAPAVTKVEAGHGRVIVTVARPATDGHSPVLRYEYTVDGGRTWVSRTDASSPFTIAGLTDGTAYQIGVRAVNAGGAGAPSAVVTAVPSQVPSFTNNTNLSGVDELEPGASALRVDGEAAPAQVTASGTTFQVADGTVAVSITAQLASGSARPLDSRGYLVLTAAGTVRVTGEGFEPGSVVDVWAFSTPRLVGTVVVAADGTFDAVLALPKGLEVGDHTLQLNGLGMDGRSRTVSTGVVLQALPAVTPVAVPGLTPVTPLPAATPAVTGTTTASGSGALAATGSEVAPAAGLGLLLLLGGVALVVLRRRTAQG